MLVLGLDGGNTKTVALVAEPDGTVVGAGWAGCSSPVATVVSPRRVTAMPIPAPISRAIDATSATARRRDGSPTCGVGTTVRKRIALNRCGSGVI